MYTAQAEGASATTAAGFETVADTRRPPGGPAAIARGRPPSCRKLRALCGSSPCSTASARRVATRTGRRRPPRAWLSREARR